MARALINKPDIVFADEPTGNLDSKNARELHRLFVQLRDTHQQTFLIVTHNEELEDEGEIYEGIDDIWPDYPSQEDFFFNEDEY